MRSEISSLHNRLGATIIYVTHDQTEAMTLGTRIVVLKDGVIMQVDSPQKLYNQPNNLFVAGFIGSPQMNFIDAQCVVEGAKAFLKFDKYQVELPEAKAKKLIDGGYAGKNVVFGIRPEDIYDSAEHLDKLLHARLIQMLQDMSYLVQRYYYTSQLQAQICQQELIQIHRLVTVITLSLHLIHTRFMYLIKKLN